MEVFFLWYDICAYYKLIALEVISEQCATVWELHKELPGDALGN